MTNSRDKNKRNRRKYDCSEKVDEVINLINFLPHPILDDEEQTVRASLQEHIDQHPSWIMNLHGRNPQNCCYHFLDNQLKNLNKKIKDFIFSIKREGKTYPPPKFIVVAVGNLGNQEFLYPEYHPDYNISNICIEALLKYESLIDSQRLFYLAAEFNDAVKENEGKWSIDSIWDFLPNHRLKLPPLGLRPTKEGSIKPKTSRMLAILLAADTTRFRVCKRCQKCFWIKRNDKEFCGDNCRQSNYRLKKGLKLQEETLQSAENKLRELKKNLNPENKLIVEAEKRVKKSKETLEKTRGEFNGTL